jgi:hypothetical protein
MKRLVQIEVGECLLFLGAEYSVFRVAFQNLRDSGDNFACCFYGCETWSPKLKDKQKLSVFENRVLRRTLAPKRGEGTGQWGRLYNEELYDVYSSPNVFPVTKSRRMNWAGYVASMGRKERCYRILVERPEGRRPLGRTRHRLEDNIKVDIQEAGSSFDWIDLAQVAGSCKCGNEPSVSVKCGEFLD